jgi:putative component of membrane protein insertase Oxa1/YidC/SpoIIIJ protein YidD
MKRFFFISCCAILLYSVRGWAQQPSLPWGRIVPQQSNGMQAPRPFRWNKNIAHNASGALIFFYQNVISEQVQANCAYTISCSEYIKQCIQTYGTARGILSGLNQYTKCTGFQRHEHTALELNRQRKIMNQVADECW